MSTLQLPKQKNLLEPLVEQIVEAGVQFKNAQQVEWLYNRYYLDGIRRFSNLNYSEGTVTFNQQSSNGEIDYRYEKVVQNYQVELGRRMRADMAPHVEKEGISSLEGVQKASVAQATLDHLLSTVDLEAVKERAIAMQLMYGTVGLACWAKPSIHLGRDSTVVEVIPPWELMPIPANPATLDEVLGVCRYRMMSLEELKSRLGDSRLPAKKDMDIVKVPYGHNHEITEMGGADSAAFTSFKDSNRSGQLSAGEENKKEREFVRVAEIWLHDENGYLDRFIIMAGGKVVVDELFVDPDTGQDLPVKPYMPIHVAREISTGGFYGRSYVELQIPTNREVEALMCNLFENAMELDNLGILMLPTTMGINVNQLKKTAKPRYAMYEPDITVPEHKPFAIQPANTGDFPGKVAAAGMDTLQDFAGHSEMLSGGAPGRVDSAQGLGMIYEAGSIPLNAPMSSMARAFIGLYKAMLSMARMRWESTTIARLTKIDDALVGLAFDSEGNVVLDKSAIPQPHEVTVKTESQLPVSKEQRKQELVSMLQMGIISPQQFRIINWKESLDFPVGHRGEFESYRKAMLNNLRVFNDGQTPGQAILNSEADKPEIHLQVLEDFMARPEFMLASVEVRSSFEALKSQVRAMLGGNVPMPMYPEQAAEMQAMAEQQMGQGGPPM